MKATFKSYMHGYTGKLDGIVYYYHPIKQICMGRKYVKPRESTANLRLKAIMANLQQIAPSDGFKSDCKYYIISFNNNQKSKLNLMISWNNLYIKLMFALAKAYPNIDLATLTREQIFADNLPCQSIKIAVEAGLLAKVRDLHMLGSLI